MEENKNKNTDEVDQFAIPDDIFNDVIETMSEDTEDTTHAFKPSTCEIVSSSLDAVTTQTEEEKDELLRLQYGDLSPDLWEGRRAEETHWVSGKLDVLENWSQPLKNPEECVVIGTTSKVAIAIRASNWKEPNPKAYADPHDWSSLMPKQKTKPTNEEKEEEDVVDPSESFLDMRTNMIEKAHSNPVIAYKMGLSDFESEAFLRHLHYELITRINSRPKAIKMLEALMELSRIDFNLRPAIQAFGPVLTNKINNLPEEAGIPEMLSQKRPGGLPKTYFVGYTFVKLTKSSQKWDSSTAKRQPDASIFRIQMCNVPSVIHDVTAPKKKGKGKGKKKKSKKATRRDAKKNAAKKLAPTKWKDVNCVFVCNNNGVVPAVAFNDTHMAVLYMPYRYNKDIVEKECPEQTKWPPNLIFVDLFELKNPSVLKDRFAFMFPSEFSGMGQVHVTLSRMGIFAVGFSRGAIVFDTLRAIKKPRVLMLKHDEPDADADADAKHGKKKRRFRVTITSIEIIHPPHMKRPSVKHTRKNDAFDDYIFKDVNLKEEEEEEEENVPEIPNWCGHVMMGTHRGECFTMCWRSGKLAPVQMIPGCEPVLSTHYSNGRLILHGVDSMSGSISSIGNYTRVPLRRPLAITTCGSLIFVLSKYGQIIVFDSFARQFCRPFNPPKGAGAGTYMLQYAYKGIHASPMEIVAVYMNGRIRKIALPPKHMWEKLEKKAEEQERKEVEKRKKEEAAAIIKQQQQKQQEKGKEEDNK